ncbi:MAG: NTP transferase domain-containing protein [Deltaproteobacteria bacterium]|nr:NTP transferase domain-containing protein [Deltaproteobacteria bacterium]
MRGENTALSTIILAAGKGTRMKSDLAKVLHKVGGRPLISYSVDLARQVGSEKVCVVIGHQADAVRKAVEDRNVIFVEQRELLGTGHAVMQAREVFCGYEGTILILCGDVPLLSIETTQALIDVHGRENAAVTVMTVILDDPGSYGRIVKDAAGNICKIVEARDASVEEKKIGEINTGIYCVESGTLFDAVSQIGNANVQKEYYLTDMIEIAIKKRLTVRSFLATKPIEVMGINTPDDLNKAVEYQKTAM